MSKVEVLAIHSTKRAAHADGRARRARGETVFTMRGDDAARFLGVVVNPAAWLVYR